MCDLVHIIGVSRAVGPQGFPCGRPQGFPGGWPQGVGLATPQCPGAGPRTQAGRQGAPGLKLDQESFSNWIQGIREPGFSFVSFARMLAGFYGTKISVRAGAGLLRHLAGPSRPGWKSRVLAAWMTEQNTAPAGTEQRPRKADECCPASIQLRRVYPAWSAAGHCP